MIRENPAAADDLTTPLGKDKKAQSAEVCRLPAPQIAAGVLGLSVVVVGALGGVRRRSLWRRADRGGRDQARQEHGEQQAAAAAAANNRSRTRHAAQPRSAEPQQPPPGTKAITIIDGSSGKASKSPCPGDGKAVAAAEAKWHAPPAIRSCSRTVAPRHDSEDRRRRRAAVRRLCAASQARRRARPTRRASRIIVGGLGISATATAEALAKLPAAVTLRLRALWRRCRAACNARARGEPRSAAAGADGAVRLSRQRSRPADAADLAVAEQNLDRLHWLMSRMQGYVGVANFMGARFTASEAGAGARPARDGQARADLCRRRLIAAQRRRPDRRRQQPALRQGRFVLDTVPTPAEIDRALTRLEMARARERQSRSASPPRCRPRSRASPNGRRRRKSRGFVLVPISMVAVKAKSS